MMTRKQRLLATFRGEPVDRPAVSFYEIGMKTIDPDDSDPYNIYNHPSWRPLLQLAEQRTDIMRRFNPTTRPAPNNCHERFFHHESWEQEASRMTRTTLKVAGRTMTSLTRRDRDMDTTWTLEHLLENGEDLKAYLDIPDEAFAVEMDASGIDVAEAELGEAGVMILDTVDPICMAASLFSMSDYLVIAMTEPDLFHRLLEKWARILLPQIDAIAAAAPGRLWRVVGSEYASEPYLPPRLYEEYVVRYTKPIVRRIHSSGGWARIHSHGRLANILPHIVAMGADGLDPIEPPPQGDVELRDIRSHYGQAMVLFGNLEVSDIENLPPEEFEKKVEQSLRDGTSGEGRGFVLMPSACPTGRIITTNTLENYRTMVRHVEQWPRRGA
jgi:uroporphyrinogen-III decarboxylase